MNSYYLGIDVGSTTVKAYLTDETDKCLFSRYMRHNADVRAAIAALLREIGEQYPAMEARTVITGSGGLAIAGLLDITFIQEVIACTKTVETYIPQTDVAIELGGEDAKITYFRGGLEQRMNGTCAGGTGAFIDQMATLLETDADGLNRLAREHTRLYPIASRCGVFAKTDVQPLINEGARREDIAASILQAVVNQTISGLACGKPIRGNVAFLGGPLCYIDQLRVRFIETLDLKPEQVIFPENAQLFVAMGACLKAREEAAPVRLDALLDKLEALRGQLTTAEEVLEPLFASEAEYEAFRERHARASTPRRDIKDHKGGLYLGIDVGSTTTKMVLTDSEGAIVHSTYASNRGDPLGLTLQTVGEIYDLLPEDAHIRKVGVTGYGEALIKTALRADLGEVETIAHYTAARRFQPDVDFILDIGGQDMKAITIRDGVIKDITLNEACSSGCGSFLETFAISLGHTPESFAQLAIGAEHPVSLGSRCTVFMNSKVKQAQKEGASPADISAGLSYSVIRNALYKVIKLRSREQLGSHVVVQGGTFYNPAVLRAFEKEAGMEVVCPDIAGLMGAYGMALLAREADDGSGSTMLSRRELRDLRYEKTMRPCGKCTNNCMLTVTTFSDGRSFISGNRCERGADLPQKGAELPNLYAYKYHRTFNYKPLPAGEARRGVIGSPRVLNMYENYPFWHTFFTVLGFRVVLSGRSSKAIFEKGIETITSESVCYPAKLTHGHVQDLIDKGVDTIFYPSVAYERVENPKAGNHYNCPIVTSYPEVIRNNVDQLREKHIRFLNPFVTLNSTKAVFKVLRETLREFDISDAELRRAVQAADAEQQRYRADIRAEGRRALDYIEKHHVRGIVLSGRPYHIDPEINHGIPDLVTAEGFAVLSEDSVCMLDQESLDLRVVDQWTYHSSLYKAASFVSSRDDLDLIQLTSFGCGLDAVTADQVAEILKARGKIYTLIKIDEGSNLGAIRIRLRSLKAVVEKGGSPADTSHVYKQERAVFTREMREAGYTILCPQMSPLHFDLIEAAARSEGYNLVVLPSVDQEAVEEGLKYVNNDACYPSILTIGQIMHALNSGKYDPDHTAIIMSQTGGECRATNYIGFIRKALQDAGLSQIPVISLNLNGLETNPGFKLTYSLGKKIVMAALYGDLFMRVLYRTRPYEAEPGAANALYARWQEKCLENVRSGAFSQFRKNIYAIVQDFDTLPMREIQKPRVGLVGEILVKFHPTANNNIVETIEAEGGEAVMPDLVDFFLYCFYNSHFQHTHYETRLSSVMVADAGIQLVELLRRDLVRALNASKHFTAPNRIEHIAEKASEIVSLGNQAGEGWFLTGEMVELIEEGVPNIVCMQPFACLPNHVTGKGVIKAMRERYPESNIVAIDYDPGASKTNQLNRIKLMTSTAFKNLGEKK